MSGKRPKLPRDPGTEKGRGGRKDDPREQARAQFERNLKKVMHRPAARVGEMRHGRG